MVQLESCLQVHTKAAVVLTQYEDQRGPDTWFQSAGCPAWKLTTAETKLALSAMSAGVQEGTLLGFHFNQEERSWSFPVITSRLFCCGLAPYPLWNLKTPQAPLSLFLVWLKSLLHSTMWGPLSPDSGSPLQSQRLQTSSFWPLEPPFPCLPHSCAHCSLVLSQSSPLRLLWQGPRTSSWPSPQVGSPSALLSLSSFGSTSAPVYRQPPDH